MMPDRTTINLEMEPTQIILDAKKLLSDKSGIDVTLMKLFFKDSEVTDDSNIGGVQNIAGSNVFNLICKEIVHCDTEMMQHNHCLCDMFTCDNVLDLKKRISGTEQVGYNVLRLNQNGNEVTDDQSLMTLKAIAGSNTIPLTANERMLMNV